MIRSRLVTSSYLMLALGIAACGGASPPPAEEPPAEPAAPAPAPAPEPAPAAEAPAEPAPKEEPPPPRKAAKDVLLAPGWDFALSYSESELKAKNKEECEKKAKEDEKKLTDCLSKAEADAANDRIKFVQDDKSNWWFVSLGKQKGKEIIYNKIQFSIGKEQTDKLVLTPTGKDGGKKPIKKLPTELVVEMPDDYTVVVHHPDQGKLVYKIKVTGDSTPKPIGEETPEKK